MPQSIRELEGVPYDKYVGLVGGGGSCSLSGLGQGYEAGRDLFPMNIVYSRHGSSFFFSNHCS